MRLPARGWPGPALSFVRTSAFFPRVSPRDPARLHPVRGGASPVISASSDRGQCSRLSENRVLQCGGEMTGTDRTPDPNLRLRGLEGHGCVRQTGRVSRAMIRSRAVCTPRACPRPTRSTLSERTQLGVGRRSFTQPDHRLLPTLQWSARTHDLGGQPGRQPSRRAYAVSAEVVSETAY